MPGNNSYSLEWECNTILSNLFFGNQGWRSQHKVQKVIRLDKESLLSGQFTQKNNLLLSLVNNNLNFSIPIFHSNKGKKKTSSSFALIYLAVIYSQAPSKIYLLVNPSKQQILPTFLHILLLFFSESIFGDIIIQSK